MVKRLVSMLGLALLGSALLSCEPEEEDGDSFQNSLRFGTGLAGTGFTLTGEATSFSLAELGGNSLWFRLESAEDIDKRFVRLYFNDITNKDFTPPQEYGHIMLATFSMEDPGTYEVKAHYVETVVDIGKETFIASKTLTITP